MNFTNSVTELTQLTKLTGGEYLGELDLPELTKFNLHSQFCKFCPFKCMLTLEILPTPPVILSIVTKLTKLQLEIYHMVHIITKLTKLQAQLQE